MLIMISMTKRMNTEKLQNTRNMYIMRAVDNVSAVIYDGRKTTRIAYTYDADIICF